MQVRQRADHPAHRQHAWRRLRLAGGAGHCGQYPALVALAFVGRCYCGSSPPSFTAQLWRTNENVTFAALVFGWMLFAWISACC